MSQKLFQYAVLWNPTQDQEKDGQKTKIIVPPSEWIMAKDEKAVGFLATKKVPDEFNEQADQIQIIIRPF